MKIIFLDRDGVINQFPGHTLYVTCLDEFRLLPGSLEAIKLFKEAGFKVYVASNQAGVAKGLYTEEDLNQMNNFLAKKLKAEGTALDGINYCTHQTEDNCPCRKPKPGLLNKVIKELGADPKNCFFLGDTFRDLETAKACGCNPVLLLSGKEKIDNKPNWPYSPELVFENILEAARYLCKNYE